MDEPSTSLGPPVLFVEDLERSKALYRDALRLTLSPEDATSAVFTLGGDMILLVTLDSGSDMLERTTTTPRGRAPTGEFNLFVEDVDEWYERLRAKGIEFFVAPVDRYWGRRTAHLFDPDGFVWEISQSID